jgi:hypothetical protein
MYRQTEKQRNSMWADRQKDSWIDKQKDLEGNRHKGCVDGQRDRWMDRLKETMSDKKVWSQAVSTRKRKWSYLSISFQVQKMSFRNHWAGKTFFSK